MVTGHRDWGMLRRYTNLKPRGLAQAESCATLDGAIRSNTNGDLGRVPANTRRGDDVRSI